MQRVNVISSNIASIGYDETAQILEVEFHHGGIYQYYDVPSTVHQQLMAASSHGSYLANYVKNRYRYQKVG